MTERRVCVMSNDGCKAPAGYRVGNGYAEGDGSCRGTCFRCGEPVCGNCSKRRPFGKSKRIRVCLSCLDGGER